MKRCLQNRFFSFFALSVVFVCATIVNVCGQVANYKFSQSNGTYTAITGGTTIAAATDPASSGAAALQGLSIKTPLPFTFKFNNVNYDTCYVSEDGFISFGNSFLPGGFPFTSTLATEGVIAAMSSDLLGYFSTSGVITSGSPTITNVAAFNGIAVGKAISAANVSAGTTVVSFDVTAKTITLSANATGGSTSATPVKWVIGEIKSQTTGTAPNRKFTIDYQNIADNGQSNPTNSSAFSFQIQLEETTNKINVVYGPYTSLSTLGKSCQVGLRGNTITDFNNRTSTTGWAATTLGTVNTATVSRSNTIFPASGLTFTWQPGSCYFPSDIGFTGITATGATLNWSAPVAGGVPSGYQWEVRTSGAAGSGATGLVASGSTAGTSASVTGLTATTAYTFYVRTDCGSGDLSVWSPAKSLKTPCSTVYTTPYKEDFNTYVTYNILPNCWTMATGKWSANTRLTAAPGTAISWQPLIATDRAAQISMAIATQGEWLQSSSINLGTLGDKRVEFDFSLFNGLSRDTTLDGDDTVALVISTDNGQTWSKNNTLQMWTAANTPYPNGKVSIVLPGYTGIVKFGLYAYEGVLDKAEFFIVNNFVVKDSACVNVNLGKDIVACTTGGRKDTLDAGYFGSNATYAWDDLSTGQKRIIAAGGTYAVGVTRNGCTERDTIKVTYSGFPVSKLGNDTVLCGVGNIILAPASTGETVRWTIQGLNSMTLNVTQSGTYAVDITNTSKCVTHDTIVVTLVPNLPPVNLGKDTTFCSGNSLTLDAGNPGLKYLWNDNSTNQTNNATATGTYSVTVTDNDGCKSRDTIIVTSLPAPIIDLGADTGICNGTQYTLDAGNAGAQYLWDDATTNQLRVVNAAGQYSVVVTGANNCTATDTIVVVVNPLPKFNSIVATQTDVRKYSFSLQGTQGANTYSWNFGDGGTNGTTATEVHQYTADGIYNVIATVSGDCGTYADTLELTVKGVGIANYEHARAGITLYPNPAHGMLTIAYPQQLQQKQFAIYNLTGAKIISANFNTDGMQQLDVSAFAPGIYCLFIVGDGNVWPSYKFVVSGK